MIMINFVFERHISRKAMFWKIPHDPAFFVLLFILLYSHQNLLAQENKMSITPIESLTAIREVVDLKNFRDYRQVSEILRVDIKQSDRDPDFFVLKAPSVWIDSLSYIVGEGGNIFIKVNTQSLCITIPDVLRSFGTNFTLKYVPPPDFVPLPKEFYDNINAKIRYGEMDYVIIDKRKAVLKFGFYYERCVRDIMLSSVAK